MDIISHLISIDSVCKEERNIERFSTMLPSGLGRSAAEYGWDQCAGNMRRLYRRHKVAKGCNMLAILALGGTKAVK